MTRAGDRDRGRDFERHREPVHEGLRRASPPTSCAMIAPISAIPSEPPTCREELRTAEPTPALSTGTPLSPAAVAGVIAAAMPMPPRSIAGHEGPVALFGPEPREVQELRRDEQHPAGDAASVTRRDPRAGPRAGRPATTSERHRQERRACLHGASSRGRSACRARRRTRPRTSRARRAGRRCSLPGTCALRNRPRSSIGQPLTELEHDERGEGDTASANAPTMRADLQP